ncbi:MAG: DNA gyrase subunit A [Euryarchaeota archaeon]|nr:DNA gyrase subunit A [Euryarchaeota archaeon]
MAEDVEGARRVIPVKIEDEMKRSYIDYAMSVIVGRALPDVRDGLKPVHRRILYAMHDMGIRSRSPYKKCARIVGEVLGKYHPHGDMAVYDALVRMAQDFNLRYPLIDGQGNFGSIDGDSAAAMRYTEARLARIAEEMLQDIDKDTVDFLPNFDDSLQEPEVLPAKLPNLLINGASGIAVGMATNIPPHNLVEVVDATIRVIDEPEVEVPELMEVIKGPDFPTGGIIYGRWGIMNAYVTGRGSVKVRARAEMEEVKGRDRIIVTELPYQVNKARLIESIAELVKDKRIEGIADLRDESDREGMRVVIELKKGAVPEIVLNQLFKHTQMETSFGIINLALVDGEPKVLGLKETIQCYIDHRREVVRRRTQFELDRAEKRAHILEGLLTALDNIDAVIKLIRGSKTVDQAREGLIENFELTKEQAQAILDMRLQKLTGLEREKIEEEHRSLKEKIAWYREVLADEGKVLAIIKEELQELKETYGDGRRTEIVDAEAELDMEDLIAEEDMVVIITREGYIKRVPVDVYRSQGRGGKGIIGMETKEGDTVENIFIASTHDYMLFFTNQGRVHWLKVYRIPESGRYSRGKAIVNLLEVGEGERITASFAIKEFTEGYYLMMATRFGKVKKTELTAYSRPRRGGIIAIGLQEGDELIKVVMTNGRREVVLATKEGKAIKFHEEDVRPMGRPAMGVRGIRLKGEDEVVGMVLAQEDESLLTVTENGFGKRTPFSEYPLQRRGGQGVINIKTTKRNGKVVGIVTVARDGEVMFTSSRGIVIRVPVRDISVIGRNTQGVTLMRLQEGDRVVGVARVTKEDDHD